MRVFDSHVHIEKGWEGYDLPVQGKNVIFNSLAVYRKHREAQTQPATALTLLFDYKSDLPFVLGEIKNKRINALKIHSRLQKIRDSDYAGLAEALRQVPIGLPIIIDAFYYGADLDVQPSLKGIIHLLQTFPDRHFVIAHCGGHRLLDYFFHLRELPNFSYELSVILHYLKDSSVYVDLKKLIDRTDKTRILFGSDHPWAPIQGQYDTLKAICSELNVSAADQDNIFFGNAQKLFRP